MVMLLKYSFGPYGRSCFLCLKAVNPMNSTVPETFSSPVRLPVHPEDAREKILTLAPLAVRVVGRILKNPKAPLNAQIQAIGIILDRTYGKPEALLKAEALGQTPEASGLRLQAILENLSRKEEMFHE